MDGLVVGIVRTSHGVRGYVKIQSLSGEKEHFFSMKEVLLRQNRREKVYRVEDVKPLGKGVIIKFDGIDTPEQGKALAGAELWVDRESAAPLKSGEFYAADINGCGVIFNGETVGTVRSVLESSLNDLLEVVLSDGGTQLVPLTEQFIGEIDTVGKTVELKDDRVLK